MTENLRARIVAALENCRTLIPEAQADAVMAVLEPSLAARGTALARKADAGPADYSEAGIGAWYRAAYFKCASCGAPDTVKPLTFRLPNGGGDLCAECAKPVIESTRVLEELIARKKAREAAAAEPRDART
jgi:hypothetical protein